MVLTKKDYMLSNQYIRKWMSNLSEKDLQFFQAVAEWKINVNDPAIKIQFKQIFFHMTTWFSLWELRWLLKAIKTLNTLPD